MARPSFRKKQGGSGSGTLLFSNEKITVGSVRKTQLMNSFGIGAIVDFKDDTVVIASADDWDYAPNDPDELESRKLFNENLSVITGAEYFLSPKTTSSTNVFANGKDILSYIFPEKQHCSTCGSLFDIHELDTKKRHECPLCKNRMTASRFIVVCANGHMDDFPYDWWVHDGNKCPSGKAAPRIKMRNISNRSDISSLRLECDECKANRSMMQVFSSSALNGYKCTCKHPHFKDPYCRAAVGCDKPMLARLRSSSGVYFPISKSALLIPPWSQALVRYMQKEYAFLKYVPHEEMPDVMRQKMHRPDLTAQEVLRSWNAVETMNQSGAKKRTEFQVNQDEYAVLSMQESTSDERFSSYDAQVPDLYRPYIRQIAVLDRLTVTQAFTGFTRTTRNELFRVDVTQYRKPWYPAVELTGEGIFIRLDEERVRSWLADNAYRYRRMEKQMTQLSFAADKFSPVYVLLHTFAHLFIREISNICGYSAASIHEKIYSHVDDESGDVNMCGVLIYVSSSDSDSSLGGLVSIADDETVMQRILDSMLERAKWCSGDPLCISSMQQGYQNLNYAACHDCALLPETSCECFNIFLDRAAVIGLEQDANLAYFAGI